MAGVQSSIQLADRMTPVLQSITSAMGMMVSSFSAAQSATESGFDTAQAVAMQQAVASASAAVVQYQEELERVQNTPVTVPELPAWSSASSQPVFTNTGAERFAQEYQAVNTAAQQLYRNQQAISAQARGMRVTPPGMLNDVAETTNRMRSLSNRIEELNSIPVNLRTDRVNNELEVMRGRLSQAAQVQGQLNSAMERMDISAANAAYQQLNSIMDSTERNIRDNLTAQEQFNQSVRSGQTAAGGLESSIKRYAAMLVSAATAGKAMNLADQVAQTTARLDLMNYGLDSTEQLQQKIYDSAQRSRGVYQTTADAVGKLGMQARNAFSSNDELIAFAEQINKTFVIAGTSAQGVDSVMLQLTQAMAAGKLQGEELNAVLDNAQPIVQNIADYMGVPAGEIKELASEGAISAEVIKNAMFAAAEETDERFAQMPTTFGQIANSIQNQALMAFQPALQQLSSVTQTEGFSALTESITGVIRTMASGAVQALDMMGQAVIFVQENWAWLGPIIAGVAAAVVAYKGVMIAYNIVQAITNGLQAISAASTALKAGADIAGAAATTTATGAQVGLNMALLACPITWIVIVIMAVIAAIVVWINRIGGLKVAWLTCSNFVLTCLDKLKIGFMTAWANIQNGIDNMQYGFEAFKAAVLNTIGNLKVMGLTILQDFINGAIDRVNAFIAAVNSIAGTSIEAVAHVEFATNAAVEEQAKQQKRASELAALKDQNAADKKARQSEINQMELDAAQRAAERQANIAAAKAEKEEKKKKDSAGGGAGGYTPEAPSLGDIAGNTGSTAANTAAMADSMDTIDTDLKYMRDAAEQEIINRFTLAELKVDINNNNTLKTQTDFNEVNRMLGEVTGEILATAAEGGYI